MARHIKAVAPIELVGRKVEVFFNLHNGLFSVRHNGRTIAHTGRIVLEDVRFVVQRAGRERVLKEGRKNIHAFVRGTVAAECDKLTSRVVQVGYNPHKADCFRTKPYPYDACGRPRNTAPERIDTAPFVSLTAMCGRPIVNAEYP